MDRVIDRRWLWGEIQLLVSLMLIGLAVVSALW
jgi:hypothetical protein